MSKRYYANFPAAPVDVIAAIAAGAGIATIKDVRVSADNSVFIDIAQDADALDGFRLTAQHLVDIAEVCGVEPQDLYVESLDDELISVTAWATPFDFSKLFIGGPHEGSICDPRQEMFEEELSRTEAALERLATLVETIVPLVAEDEARAKLPGEEDSEEMVEATAAIVNQSREAKEDVEPSKAE